jgi:hypothetical protein
MTSDGCPRRQTGSRLSSMSPCALAAGILPHIQHFPHRASRTLWGIVAYPLEVLKNSRSTADLIVAMAMSFVRPSIRPFIRKII